MSTLSEPLTCRETQNSKLILEQIPGRKTKNAGWSHLSKEELQLRRSEGRRKATRKSAYVKAILRHCRECFGTIPVRQDCGGSLLRDGTVCNLYPHNTAEKCRHSTKKALRLAIRKECKYCGGEEESCGKCNLRFILEISDQGNSSDFHRKNSKPPPQMLRDTMSGQKYFQRQM